MGIVYVAEQSEPNAGKVALKIIKPGMDTKQVIARFEAERQTLALMDHPNIAKVLDAGTTEKGRPYFAMELVRGLPITAYCDKHARPTRQRLELFIAICNAVQHAHEKGIIHRDIKPGNLLVARDGDREIPKVIDFGVAKATQQQLTDFSVYTRFHQIIGTPLYMSPEQTDPGELDIDLRSDEKSLEIQKGILADDPHNLDQLHDAANSSGRLALAKMSTDDSDGAMTAIQKGREYFREIAEAGAAKMKLPLVLFPLVEARMKICQGDYEEADRLSVGSEFHRIRTPRAIDNLGIATALSADGSVAIGFINDPYLAPGHYWTAEDGRRQLPAPAPYTGNQIVGVSDDGTIFVGTLYAEELPSIAYRWTEQGGYELLGIPDGYDVSRSKFVTSDGGTVIVTSDGDAGSAHWLWREEGGFEFLPNDEFGIPRSLSADGQVIVYTRGIDSQSEGFIPKPDELGSIFSGSNSGGEVMIGVTSSDDPDIEGQAARWVRGQEVEPLGVLDKFGHKRSRPHGLSADGTIVVGAGQINLDGLKDRRAFVWDAHHGMRELADVLRTEYGIVNPHPWGLSRAEDISDDKRTILGHSRNNDNQAGSDGDMWVVQLDWPIGTIHGDLDLGGSLDLADIDELQDYVRTGQYDSQSDFNFDDVIDEADLQFWVHDLKQTYFGDANLDGVFGTRDLVTVFQAGEYEDNIPLNSTWGTGDWNSDGEFDTSDLVSAFQDGGYEEGPRVAINAVPEPTSQLLLVLGVAAIVTRWRPKSS